MFGTLGVGKYPTIKQAPYAGPTRLVNGVGYRINQGIQAANSALLVVSLPTRTTCCCSSSLLAVSLLDTVEFTQIDF
jgi:hypothetical protein